MKALAFDQANQIIGGVESRFLTTFKELEKEIDPRVYDHLWSEVSGRQNREKPTGESKRED